MKNKISIAEISRRLGISKSTVSKALGNKPGVDEETKKNILKYAKSVGYFSQKQEEYDVLLLIPARYKHLCPVFQKMMNDAALKAKCGIYSCEEEYVKILKDTAKNPPLILAVCPMHLENGENLFKKFEEVWFTGDLLRYENSFYFGTNPKAEAEEMAEKFICSGKNMPIFMHSHKSVVNSRRSEMFAKILADENIYGKANIMLDKAQELSVPLVARQLSRFYKNADSIYCGDEVFELTKKALKKLGAEEIEVFFNNDEENLKSAVTLMIKNAKAFIENGDYPVCKYNFI